MVRDCSLFNTFTQEKIEIKTGNPDSRLTAIGFGTARIFTNGKILDLENCLLVPNISQQLISLVKLISSSISIIKKGDRFEVHDKLGIILVGNIVDNLLHTEYSSVPSAYVSSANNHSLWHQRLGHPSNQVMRSMNLPTSNSDLLCEVKSDTFQEFKTFANLVENFQDLKIKEVVSDQGGEFLNTQFKEYCGDRGILQTFSPADTPEHNGFAEWANRTLLNKSRCLMLTSNLPKNYWAEAVNTSTFISNITLIGCKAYIPVMKTSRSWKLGNSGDIGILVGFENKGTSFRILCLRDRKLITTLHARFDESVFPRLSDSAYSPLLGNGIEDNIFKDSFEASSSVDDITESSSVVDGPDSSSTPDETPVGEIPLDEDNNVQLVAQL
jgi:hypothetical protein